MAGLLRLPEEFNLSENYPAMEVTRPMLSVKEQAQSVYAEIADLVKKWLKEHYL